MVKTRRGPQFEINTQDRLKISQLVISLGASPNCYLDVVQLALPDCTFSSLILELPPDIADVHQDTISECLEPFSEILEGLLV
jgi:hypothetical protein